VEAIPPMAPILTSASHRLDGQQITAFYCGDDAEAKGRVTELLADLDLDPVDAGPLTSARYIEPAGMQAVPVSMSWHMTRSPRKLYQGCWKEAGCSPRTRNGRPSGLSHLI
jgi:hypothetical protein